MSWVVIELENFPYYNNSSNFSDLEKIGGYLNLDTVPNSLDLRAYSKGIPKLELLIYLMLQDSLSVLEFPVYLHNLSQHIY